METIQISLKDLTKVLDKMKYKNKDTDRVRIPKSIEMLHAILNENKQYNESDIVLNFSKTKDWFQLYSILVEHQESINDMNLYVGEDAFECIQSVQEEMKV